MGFYDLFLSNIIQHNVFDCPGFPSAPLPAKPGLSEPAKMARKDKMCWGQYVSPDWQGAGMTCCRHPNALVAAVPIASPRG